MSDTVRMPLLPPDVGFPSFARGMEGPPPWWPQDPSYAWHILAEGDSWFTLAAIPSSNLLFELRLARWAQIYNIAYPGDTIKHVGQLRENSELKKVLAEPNFSYRWDAILMSGGGNDLIDAASRLIAVQPFDGNHAHLPSSYVVADKLNELLAAVQDAFRFVVALRDSSLNAGCPIVVHTYDYPTPRNEPARFLNATRIAGPWIYPVFANTNLPLPLQQGIVCYLMDKLAEALLALDSASGTMSALPNFHVVDTRNTLIMANPVDVGVSHDWLNEIHPSHSGYRKIAAKLSERLNAVLA